MLSRSRSLRVADVARELDIARSTAHRALAMLQHHGFVAQDPKTKAYLRGATLIEVGLAAINQLPIRAAAREPLRALSAASGETCELCILDGLDAVVVEVVPGVMPLRIVEKPGDRMPAHLTAAGKAMLAQLPLSELHALFPHQQLETATDSSIATRDALEAALAEVRHCGYATNRCESGSDLVGVAAAVIDGAGEAPGAMTIALPWSRTEDDFDTTLGPQVRRAARATRDALNEQRSSV
jgi:IclR family acetate operon transcriptional repressor